MNKTDILEKKWINYGRWTQPTISGAFWTHWDEAECAREVSQDSPLPAIVFLDGYHLTPLDEDHAVKTYFNKRYSEGTLGEFLEKFETSSKKSEARILAILGNTMLSNAEYARELFAAFLEVVGAWSFLFRFSTSLEEIAREQGLAVSDDDILRHMRPYTRVTLLEQQTIELKEFARALRAQYPAIPVTELTKHVMDDASTPLLAKIHDHVQEFSWFGTHHWEGEPYTLEKCLSDIQDILNKGGDVEEGSVAVSSSEGDQTIWKLLAAFAYWRTHCAEVSDKAAYLSRERLTDVAKKWSITYEELTWLSSGEIIKALDISEDSIELPTNFAERKAGYGAWVDNGVEHIVVGAELATLIDAAVPKVDTSVSEIKGTVASKGGVITGIARIIMGPSEFASFVAGDILVANETTPDFVPLMKNAAAIVTDTGGITSHAAIVSRELKKPCVIGTKIATKVFKNGDMVEVDAINGIVRKI